MSGSVNRLSLSDHRARRLLGWTTLLAFLGSAAGLAQDSAPPAAAEVHDLLAVEVEDHGLRIDSSGSIRSVGMIPRADGRTLILLANHRSGWLPPVRTFPSGAIARLELRGGGDGEAALTRILVTPRRPQRFRLHTSEASAWLRWADSEASTPADAILPPAAKSAAAPRPVSASPASTAPAGPSLRTTRGLNVRKGPGKTFGRTSVLYAGQVVVELGRQGSWTWVRFVGGAGWVHGNFLEEDSGSAGHGATAAVEKEASIPPPADRSLRTTGSLNVRSGPAKTAWRLGVLSPGQRVEELARDGDWVRVKFPDGVGWVNGAYLENSPEKPAVQAAEAKPGRARTITETLNVFSGPGAHTWAIDVLETGRRVEELARDGDWVEVKYPEGGGWIHVSHLAAVPEPQEAGSGMAGAGSVDSGAGK